MRNLSSSTSNRIRRGFDKLSLTLLVILLGCLEDKVDVLLPRTGPVTIQMHNFNSLDSTLEEGTAPLIHYFVQRTDGTYSFTMSMDKTGWESPGATFETDWSNEYTYVEMDENGRVIRTFVKKFSENGGFENINAESPNQYKVIDERLVYSRLNLNDNSEQIILKLNPESGVSNGFTKYVLRDPFCTTCDQYSALHVASNRNFITTNLKPNGNLEYSFFTPEGSFAFSHDLPLNTSYFGEKGYYSHFMAERDDEYYFLNFPMDQTQSHWYDLIHNSSDQNGYFYLMLDFPSSILPNYNIELKFGPLYSQDAYRYIGGSYYTAPSDYTYRDIASVPFEAWDITNNRQLSVGFHDLDKNGAFGIGDIILITDLEYVSPENKLFLTENGGIANFYSHMVDSYWYGLNTTVSIHEQIAPSGVIKINAQGITKLNSEVSNQPFPLHDVLPYDRGFAALCNTSHYQNSDGLGAKILLFNENFELERPIQIGDNSSSQEKIVSNGNALLYCSVQKARSLQLVTFKNQIQSTRDLPDLAQYSIENFKATPTGKGGWAILVWVWQTPNTRDLLFMEFDENLNLVKNH